jgi:hypothetical protein
LRLVRWLQRLGNAEAADGSEQVLHCFIADHIDRQSAIGRAFVFI